MMVENFEKNGFIIKKGLFSLKDIKLYDREFNKIVNQLKDSKENINARWGSALTSNIEHQDSMVIHTHNVQNYSSVMLQMILHKIFLDEVEKIIGRGSGFVAVEIPFTPRAKRVVDLSLEEARQLGHN